MFVATVELWQAKARPACETGRRPTPSCSAGGQCSSRPAEPAPILATRSRRPLGPDTTGRDVFGQLEADRGGALVVVMNRDERRDRAPARRPRRWRGAGRLHWRRSTVRRAEPGSRRARIRRRPRAAEPSRRGRRRHPAGAHQPRPSRGGAGGRAGRAGRAGVRAAGLRSYALVPAAGRRPPRDAAGLHVERLALTSRRLAPALGFLTSSSWNAARRDPGAAGAIPPFLRAHPAADPRGPRRAARRHRRSPRRRLGDLHVPR